MCNIYDVFVLNTFWKSYKTIEFRNCLDGTHDIFQEPKEKRARRNKLIERATAKLEKNEITRMNLLNEMINLESSDESM